MERFAFFFPKNYLFFWYLLLHNTGLQACSWSLWEKDQLGHLCLFFSDKSFSAFLSLNKFIVNVADLKFIFPDTNADSPFPVSFMILILLFSISEMVGAVP